MDDYLWNKVISFYQHRTALMIKKHVKEWKDSNDHNGFDSNDLSFFIWSSYDHYLKYNYYYVYSYTKLYITARPF